MSRYERIKDLNLSHRAVVVYYYLCERANKEGKCWPAVPTIAREIKLSEKTVRRAILDLCKAKVLETEQRYRTKGGKSSLLFRVFKKEKPPITKGEVYPLGDQW